MTTITKKRWSDVVTSPGRLRVSSCGFLSHVRDGRALSIPQDSSPGARQEWGHSYPKETMAKSWQSQSRFCPPPPGDMLLSNYVTCKQAANLTDTLGETLPPLQHFQMCPLVVHSRHSHRSLRPRYTAPLHPVTSGAQQWIRVGDPHTVIFRKGRGFGSVGGRALPRGFKSCVAVGFLIWTSKI